MLNNVLSLAYEQDPLEGLGDPNTGEEEVDDPDPATALDNNENNSIDEHHGIKSEIIECETIIKEEIEDDEYNSQTADS